MTFKPLAKDVYFSKSDPNDPRLGDFIQSNLEQADFTIMGYPDDEGIQLNGGRIGAKEAPDKIRWHLSKMTPSPTQIKNPKLLDLGNFEEGSLTLKQRHEKIKTKVADLLNNNHRLITLGGGHDFAYPDGMGFLHNFSEDDCKPLIINIDAHLDVRDTTKGFHSGTPFYRLINEPYNFDLVQIAIQKQCNSKQHWSWCLQNKVKLLPYDEYILTGQSFVEYVCDQLQTELLKRRPCYLSIDIDAFSSSYAMGCSQSWPLGLTPHEFFPLLEVLIKRLDIKILGIYEVSPPLDSDDRTSKLASQIIHKYIYSHEF